MPTHEEPLAHAARMFVDRFTRTDVERQRAALVRIARSHTDGFVPAELLPLAEVLSGTTFANQVQPGVNEKALA